MTQRNRPTRGGAATDGTSPELSRADTSTMGTLHAGPSALLSAHRRGAQIVGIAPMNRELAMAEPFGRRLPAGRDRQHFVEQPVGRVRPASRCRS